MEGRALELIPNTNPTVAQIKDALRNSIKPDNSTVISGKMLALHANKNNLTDYAKEAEQLAEALERTLVIEGTTQQKAREMATEKTVEMCRQNARTDFMRSVLAASAFATPKDAIAKYVIEVSKETQEKQILAIRQNNSKGKNKNYRGKNKWNNKNNGRNNNNNNGNQSRTYYNRNGDGRGGGGRGRGNGRYNGNNNNNVRMLENSNVPQVAYLGAPSAHHMPQITEQ